MMPMHHPATTRRARMPMKTPMQTTQIWYISGMWMAPLTMPTAATTLSIESERSISSMLAMVIKRLFPANFAVEGLSGCASYLGERWLAAR